MGRLTIVMDLGVIVKQIHFILARLTTKIKLFVVVFVSVQVQDLGVVPGIVSDIILKMLYNIW